MIKISGLPQEGNDEKGSSRGQGHLRGHGLDRAEPRQVCRKSLHTHSSQRKLKRPKKML